MNMNDKALCPLCGKGSMTAYLEPVESEYKGTKAMVPLHYAVCSACTSDFANPEHSRLNKRAVLAFRKSVDGLLTGADILALRKRFGLTQTQAAQLFGGGPVAFSKYENDDVAHSEAMDSLLRLVRRSEAAYWELVAEKGMTAELAPAARVALSA
jgi:HTH-type transcriptional regulator / antitoxin MqsA